MGRIKAYQLIFQYEEPPLPPFVKRYPTIIQAKNKTEAVEKFISLYYPDHSQAIDANEMRSLLRKGLRAHEIKTKKK